MAAVSEQLIEALRKEGIETPVIVISSVNYRGNPPAGADAAWQRELAGAVKPVQS